MAYIGIPVTPGTGPDVAFKTNGDGTKSQVLALDIGVDGVSSQVTPANPLPSTDVSAQEKLDTIVTALGNLLTELTAKTEPANVQSVSATSLPLPVGAATLSAQAFTNSGQNIIQQDQDLWTRGANVASYTANYADSIIPGRRSALVAFTNGGGGIAQSTYIKGRTDGVGFTLSWWMKGTGTSYVAAEMRAQDGAGVDAQFVNASFTVGTTWTRFYCSGVCPVHNAALIYVNIYFGASVSVEMDGVMLNVGDLPLDYSPPAIRHPNASFFQVTVGPVVRSSIYMLGDSLIGGANGFECRTELSRLTGNSFIYNAGVGGETSTQVLARWNASYGKAGWVVICAGRNDGFAQATVLANIASMVALIPHGRFIICAIPNGSNEPLGGGTCEYIESLNAILKANYGDHFADWRQAHIANMPLHVPRPEYLSDVLHPNAVGFALMARSITDQMIKLGAPFASGGGTPGDSGKQDALFAELDAKPTAEDFLAVNLKIVQLLDAIEARLPPQTALREVNVRLNSSNNAAMNAAQWAGQNAVSGAGASGNGAPRVTPANDTIAGGIQIFANVIAMTDVGAQTIRDRIST